MRITLFILLLFISHQLFSQNKYSIYINGNYALNKDFIQKKNSIFPPSEIRKYACDIGVRYNLYTINKINFELGLTTTIWGRKNAEIYEQTLHYLNGGDNFYTDIQKYTFTNNYIVFDLKIPLLLCLKQKKLNYKIGPVFHTNSLLSRKFENSYLQLKRNYNIGYQSSIGYDIFENYNIFFEYSKQFNIKEKNDVFKRDNIYSFYHIFGFGVVYTIVGSKHKI
ncbi:MAG: hypothetical protein BWY22_01617 [Bacteroidetes bacterium ADurb.Bin217]|nr:MAG: hypothetical protein BWY22_01617 [Bacteroidetes bacterium ADurb.Bin217]